MSPATDVAAAREARLRALAKEDPEEFRRAAHRFAQRHFRAHPGGQEDILQSAARFRTLAAGRRWGKTKVAAHEIVKRAQKPNQMIWWVANTYKNVSRGYREVVNQLPPSWLAKPAPAYTSTTKILQLKNGTMIEFYSGGSPDSLAGEGVDFVVVDEAALIPDSVWQQLIRPTLMDTGGEAFIISTPRGHNWFYDMWQLGQSDRPGYDSWRFPQTANPFVPTEETASAKLELPKIIFEQEIMAEFLAAGASIFGIGLEREGAIIDEIVEPRGNVFVGIDLAKKQDFTVITADREEDGLPCYFERFQDMDWPTQQKRIGYAIEELEMQPGVESVTALVDSTGLGDVVYDNLIAAGVDVIPIDFNGNRKEQMARLLAADMEHGKAVILGDMKDEFGHYEFTLTPNGHYKFSAPSGKHDDMVAAKMLAHWGRIHEGGSNIEIITIERDDPAAEAALRETILIPTRPEKPDTALDIMNRPEAWDNVAAEEFLLNGAAGAGGRGYYTS
jgi:hypothetical protein